MPLLTQVYALFFFSSNLLIPQVECYYKTTDGKCCSIPFTYGGVKYHSCTTVNYHTLWCSLNSTYKGNWENCGKKQQHNNRVRGPNPNPKQYNILIRQLAISKIKRNLPKKS